MLRIESLTRRFGDQTILKALSLDVPEGDVACLVGPSGCGKSTLLRLVAGLDRPDGGQIRLGETTLSAPGWALEPHKRRLNMVFQDYALWPHMRVSQIVGYGLRHMTRADRDARVAHLLKLVQIPHLADRLPSQISGGQQQRVAIARALATDPDILLLDEPLSNLDVQLRLEMRKEFSELFKAVGKTVLYVTHDPLEACAFADTLVVMREGEIEQMGSPESLFAEPRSAWIATLAGYETRMEGELTEISGRDRVGVRIGDQLMELPRRHIGLGRTGRAVVMVPSAAISLADDAGRGRPGTLKGQITHCLFEGRGWRVVIDIEGQPLSLNSTRRFAPGGWTTVHVDASAAAVFPQ
ncbi:ABC transporter ATP-binding protein [Pelagibacterium montanilacus]|uniref:ABC transporter ATP-binding protein n=1 Tax=Pelagibacterium montanilacus TaxID=2185280 RepID=UPI000F8F8214|nr:ABC transporter ATP-binding protein [Pelagibacterium montanilacus]